MRVQDSEQPGGAGLGGPQCCHFLPWLRGCWHLLQPPSSLSPSSPLTFSSAPSPPSVSSPPHWAPPADLPLPLCHLPQTLPQQAVSSHGRLQMPLTHSPPLIRSFTFYDFGTCSQPQPKKHHMENSRSKQCMSFTWHPILAA